MATSFSPSLCKDHIRSIAANEGFDACGFARAREIAPEAQAAYETWISEGKHGCLQYMERHAALRNNPQLLLEGAATVMVLAMNYYPQRFQSPEAPQFAYYAYGNDYHEVVRQRASVIVEKMRANYGGDYRICVDTAPLRERYWAQQAGVGFVGLNNQLIIPGKGSYFFLCAILTTLEITPDEPLVSSCGNCRRCVKACPAGALSNPPGAVDARRCLSCLTIEYRGELPPSALKCIGNRVYGCDECQKICPHNAEAEATKIAEFQPSEELLTLDAKALAALTDEKFRLLFRHSAVKRTKHSGLQRNISAVLQNKTAENDTITPKKE